MARFSLPFHVPPASTASRMDEEEIDIARERGRLGAEEIYRTDPEKRAEGERQFGVEYMRHRYPRAYLSTASRFIRSLYWG